MSLAVINQHKIAEDTIDELGMTKKLIGGSAWESNPPGTVLTPHTGFEVREPHQPAAHFHWDSI